MQTIQYLYARQLSDTPCLIGFEPNSASLSSLPGSANVVHFLPFEDVAVAYELVVLELSKVGIEPTSPGVYPLTRDQAVAVMMQVARKLAEVASPEDAAYQRLNEALALLEEPLLSAKQQALVVSYLELACQVPDPVIHYNAAVAFDMLAGKMGVSAGQKGEHLAHALWLYEQSGEGGIPRGFSQVALAPGQPAKKALQYWKRYFKEVGAELPQEELAYLQGVLRDAVTREAELPLKLFKPYGATIYKDARRRFADDTEYVEWLARNILPWHLAIIENNKVPLLGLIGLGLFCYATGFPFVLAVTLILAIKIWLTLKARAKARAKAR